MQRLGAHGEDGLTDRFGDAGPPTTAAYPAAQDRPGHPEPAAVRTQPFQRAVADVGEPESAGVVRIEGLKLGHLGQPTRRQRRAVRVVTTTWFARRRTERITAAKPGLDLLHVGETQQRQLPLLGRQVGQPHRLPARARRHRCR